VLKGQARLTDKPTKDKFRGRIAKTLRKEGTAVSEGGRHFCENCGTEIRQTANFCPNCGTAQHPKLAEPTGPLAEERTTPLGEEPTAPLTPAPGPRRIRTQNVAGVVNRIAALPLWAKSVLALASLGLAVILSPLTAVAALLGLAIATVVLVFRVFKGRPLRTWGFVALGSLFFLIAFTGISYGLYGGSQPTQQVSAPVEKTQEVAQSPQEDTQEETTEEKATQEATNQEKATASPDTPAENATKTTAVVANKEQVAPSNIEQSAPSEPASQKITSQKTVTVTASPSIEEQGCRFFTQDEWTRATSEERDFISQCDQILRPYPDQGSLAGSGKGAPSNDRYYKNVDGIWVPSPDYSTDGSVPADATAQCADGTYSKSLNSRGTCSSHGGVSQWLR
jgi:Protein of unknown function (DUF3761)/zinc-ribbon domain